VISVAYESLVTLMCR